MEEGNIYKIYRLDLSDLLEVSLHIEAAQEFLLGVRKQGQLGDKERPSSRYLSVSFSI